MLTIDGAHGGGQLLRSALSLSAVTGKPFRITHIRGKRANPGLQPQHLTAVNATASICHATVQGNTLHSHELAFHPGKTIGGTFTFDIGTAGSTTLVFQTLLPALLFADQPSTITITGGTANPLAPPALEVKDVFLWHLEKFGIKVDFDILKEGFYPAGGGTIRTHVQPLTALREVHLLSRGDHILTHVFAVVAQSLTKRTIAERLLQGFQTHYPHDHHPSLFIRNVPTLSPGCYLLALTWCEYAHLGTTVLCEKNRKAEDIGKQCAEQLVALFNSGAAVDSYTADQLLIYLALQGKGSLLTNIITPHIETNIRVIEQFLPVKFAIEGTTIKVLT